MSWFALCGFRLVGDWKPSNQPIVERETHYCLRMTEKHRNFGASPLQFELWVSPPRASPPPFLDRNRKSYAKARVVCLARGKLPGSGLRYPWICALDWWFGPGCVFFVAGTLFRTHLKGRRKCHHFGETGPYFKTHSFGFEPRSPSSALLPVLFLHK